MAGADPRGRPRQRVAYDGDQKLLAFLGAVAFILASLFWSLLGLRLALSGSSVAAAPFAAAVLSAIVFLLAWGLRVKMQHGLPLTGWELRRLLIAGLVLGVAVGGLPYFVLTFKLEDPDFLHIASEPEPEHLPPAAR